VFFSGNTGEGHCCKGTTRNKTFLGHVAWCMSRIKPIVFFLVRFSKGTLVPLMGNCFGSRYKVHEPYSSQPNSGTFFMSPYYISLFIFLLHYFVYVFNSWECICNAMYTIYNGCNKYLEIVDFFFEGLVFIVSLLRLSRIRFSVNFVYNVLMLPLMGLWRKWLWCVKFFCEWIDFVNLIWVWNNLCFHIFA